MDDRMERALEALQLANSIMDYCQGDAWERECTESDRKRFAEIYETFFPEPKQENTATLPTWDTVRTKLTCPECGKVVMSSMALCLHIKDKHGLEYPAAKKKALSVMRDAGLDWRRK